MESVSIVTPDGVADVPLGKVCHICHRALGRQVVAERDLGRLLAQTAWTKVCGRCASIDAQLAAAYGARMLTPVDPRVTGGDVLHNRLWGDGEHGFGTRLRHHHLDAVLALAEEGEAAGVKRLAAKYPGGPPWARFLRWEAWQTLFPPSLDASVRGYQDYVEGVHPWIDSVEPRVADAGWLAGIAALASSSDG